MLTDKTEGKVSMTGKERRKQIIKVLETSVKPVSGTVLAGKMGVSRQVIVQDMALLRATDKNIISTTRGYLLYKEDKSMVKRVLEVSHNEDEICEELYTIVDNGGKMLDVSVYHSVYGMITADLIIQNRREADDFLRRLVEEHTVPLFTLTNGNHIHTIEAENEQIMEDIVHTLREKGFLVEEEHD
ncbi:MAG: transcription repressor NadR [Lachnospiraceae bacterium]|nr:transcription repressor NadR [Lachnospiraceae bacterium]